MPPKQVPKPRPYHNYLTPLLHRQFVRASLLSFCACYLASLLLTDSLCAYTLLFRHMRVLIAYVSAMVLDSL
jgi:hypothetical protein